MAVSTVTLAEASSPLGWKEAVAEGLARARKTLRNITDIDVLSHTARVENQEIKEYCVTIKITFVLEELAKVGHW